YDITDAAIRVELEGCVHRFGRQTVGQVRAGAPSMVVSIDVTPGQRVSAGQHLGLLEAMKMEIGFSAPVAGTITEVRVSKGQQVAAGDTLIVIEPERADGAEKSSGRRLRLPDEVDPLAMLFDEGTLGELGAPNLIAAERAPAAQRSLAMQAVNEEIRRILLGFDISERRFNKLLDFVEAPLPEGLGSEFRDELAQLRSQLAVFVQVEQLFSRARPVSEGGALGPSNSARFRGYLRRMRSQGAGVAQEFLDMLKGALAHYGISSLEHSDELEKSIFRMFATQRDPEPRRRLVMAVLRRLIALVDLGVDASGDEELREALSRIAGLRDMVSNALADNALEAYYRVFQRPELARHAEATAQRLEGWLTAAEANATSAAPPASVLVDLSSAPSSIFQRVACFLRDKDKNRRAIAVSAVLRRLYAPKQPSAHASEPVDSKSVKQPSALHAQGGTSIDRLQFNDGLVLGAFAAPGDVDAVTKALAALAKAGKVLALELVVPVEDDAAREAAVKAAEAALGGQLPASRFTLTSMTPDYVLHHDTFVLENNVLTRAPLLGMHPEAAERVDMARYKSFDLERLWDSDDVYCFYAKAKQDEKDERLFVLADVRGRPADGSKNAEQFVPIFERAFQEATRVLRLNLGVRDPRRELQWNRLMLHLQHEIELDAVVAQGIARRLLSNTRYLGLEKTIVRLRRASSSGKEASESTEQPSALREGRQVELAFSDLASSRLDMVWRKPRRVPLVPATPYERKVAACRRRELVYPYEIVRMLTQGNEAAELALAAQNRDSRPVIPVGTFEEYDLDPNSKDPVAVSVQGREPGKNTTSIVFGVISTPTKKIPEGMKRVLVLSDPTMGMGSLATPECDRLYAAIDLAEKL
ncbi:MAG TPA: biotin/lipoyl-containing protein, partial [Polyangiales bacterium]|nr:biotin/lipoyl-containing protein [Polyangiales bacterium]